MNRRSFLKSIGMGVAAVCLPATLLASAPVEQKPHLTKADMDLRYEQCPVVESVNERIMNAPSLPLSLSESCSHSPSSSAWTSSEGKIIFVGSWEEMPNTIKDMCRQ